MAIVPESDLPESASRVPANDLPTTGGGAALVPPKVGGKPSSEETKQRVSQAAQSVGEFLFEVPTREDFSGSQIAGTGGVAAGLSVAAPKMLQGVGKGVSLIPGGQVPGRVIQGVGTALSAVPAARRAAVGGFGGAVGDVAEQGMEMAGIPRVASMPASMVIGGATSGITNILGKALNLEGKPLAEMLRKTGVDGATKILKQAGYTTEQAERELASAQQIEKQLAQRESVAEKRFGEKQTTPMLQDIRQTILDKVNAVKVRAQTNAQEAGLNAQQAAGLVNDAEQGVLRANQAVDALEQKMLSLPTMNKEEFGKQLQVTTQQLFDEASKLRKKESKIAEVINAAGNYLKVPTNNLQAMIDSQLKDIRNPALQGILEQTKNLAVTLDKNGQPINALTVKSADSLKAYLDYVINAKQFKDTKLDKEIVNRVKDLRKQLVENLTTSYQPYRDAMSTFRTLSRPLDIVERNGALKRVIETDPMSLDYKMAEAEVTGLIIAKANAGNKVFQRLLEKNAGIKDSARLYFTKELFGKEAAPTEAVMRTFLRNNERPLKQLGLYEDFRNLRVAKTTAQNAVDEAKDVQKVAVAGSKEAESKAKLAESEAKRLTDLSQTASSRLADTLKTGDTLEETLRKSKARAEPTRVETAQRITAANKTIEQQQEIKSKYNKLVDDLKNAKPNEVPKKVESLTEDLYKNGSITLEERRKILDDVRKNQNIFTDAEKAQKRIGKLLGLSTAVGLGSLLFGNKQDVITYK
jgi:hypothetical protein